MNRRDFAKRLILFTAGSTVLESFVPEEKNIKPTFLIISGWQTINIGDIAHTPGLLAMIDKHYPHADYYLWPKDIEGHGVEKMLLNNFPKLKIIKGNYNKEDLSVTPELKSIFDKCDILLHGSGPHVQEFEKINSWLKHTDKPIGVCGVTVQHVYPELAKVIDKSSPFLTRETKSLDIVRRYKGSENNTDFFPDATFNLELKNEEKADNLMQKLGLTNQKFICIIPRLRYTPYYRIYDGLNWSDEKIKEVNETNDRYKEIDHEKLRTVMIKWVRETGNKVLICPEMTYQTEIMDELLINPLPEDVRSKVVKRGYGITDEAASVYKRAFAVVSMECHSPIIAFANNTPAFYVRQKEDTIKGQMYYDIGLSDWVFEIDEVDGDLIYDRLSEIIKDPHNAEQKIASAYKVINRQNEKAVNIINHAINYAG